MNTQSENKNTLRILHLEDVHRDAELIRERLIDSGLSLQIDWASNEKEFINFLENNKYDLILADYLLPGFDGLAALRLAQSHSPGLPFICVSGVIGEENAVELLKYGATDYISKDRLNNLPQVIRRALTEVAERRAREIAEAALWDRDLQFQKLSASVPGMIYQFTRRPDGTYCMPFSTDAIKEMFGCSARDVREDFSPITKVIFPEDLDKLMASIEYSAKHFTEWSHEYRVQLPGQSIKWFLGKSTPEKLADGSVTWYGFNTDITERKKATEVQEKTLSLLNSITENSTDAIYIKDTQGRYLLFNKESARITGKTPEEVLGKDDYSVFPPDDAKALIERDKRVMESGEVKTYEEVVTTIQGPTTYLANKGPLYDIEGKVSGMFGISRDISKLKQREQEMKKAKEHAEESDRLKSAFLSNMSHEIRTPMNSIVGFSQLLSAKTLADQERLEYAKIINESCRRLLNTINDILDISRLDAGQTIIKRKTFQINKLLQELHHVHINAFMQKKIELRIKIPPALTSLVIFTDEQKIYQILNNLLSNACKFTERGYVEYGLDLIDNNLEFFVKDTGIGVAKEKQEFIFGRFNQEDISDSRAHEGSGLGLAITKGFVTILGGKIWIESQRGVGSTFKFTIPFQTAPAALSDLAPRTVSVDNQMSLDWSKKTILIAEDEISNFLLLKTILFNRTNAEILHAHNGYEALEMFKNNMKIELILMDLKMPGMDGFTATRKIRETNQKIPILALSAYSQPEDREKAIQAGCNDFINKPFEVEILLKVLAKTIK